MNKLKFASLIIILMLLAGCSSMGLPTMNAVKGKINNGIYNGKIGEQPGLGGFSVKVPQASNNYEFSYMQMKEEIGSDNTYVSFGPAAIDFSIYRVFIGVRDQVPFEKFKAQAIPMIAPFIAKSYGQPIYKIYQQDITYKGHPALYAVYTQHLPSYFDPIGMHQIEGVMLTHAIYYIDYGKYLVVLWAMGNSGGGSNAITDKSRSQMINRTWKPQLEFVNSFRLY